jgi:hypothetical protein
VSLGQWKEFLLGVMVVEIVGDIRKGFFASFALAAFVFNED